MKDEKQVEVLLVEDKDEDIEMTCRALRNNNLANRIHVEKDGQAALDFIYGCSPEDKCAMAKVILLDIKLPGISGLELLEKLKSDERTRFIPVVMLTSSEEEVDLVRTYDLGVNSYIVKPVDFADFARAMKEIGFYWLVMNRCPETTG
ncbi:MAG: response regulator [Candidatus Omnitrophica bacterium]|nr:response regulator [Candidatus Omnitrophota bacterium]